MSSGTGFLVSFVLPVLFFGIAIPFILLGGLEGVGFSATVYETILLVRFVSSLTGSGISFPVVSSAGSVSDIPF